MVVIRKALYVSESDFCRDDTIVGTSLHKLALLYETQGQYAQAEPLCRRALEIWEKASGSDCPDVAQTLDNMAALYRAANREAETAQLEQRAAAIRAGEQ
jgi:tetratricopeptide (TPR) repeat protein